MADFALTHSTAKLGSSCRRTYGGASGHVANVGFLLQETRSTWIPADYLVLFIVLKGRRTPFVLGLAGS